MADRHQKNPITFRPGQKDGPWLEQYAQLHGMSERSVLGQALASFRMTADKGWNAAELLELLTVILGMLNMPYAASAGDEEIRAKILDQRLISLTSWLEILLRENDGSRLTWFRDQLLEAMDKYPATGYRTDYDEVMADMRGIPVAQYKAEKEAAAASATAAIRTEIEV